MRRSLLLAALFACLLTTAGHAAPITPKKSMWGPVERNGESQFPIYADLGVGIVQQTIRWNQVAPTRPANPTDPYDPAYQWDPEFDLAVSEAQKYGMDISFAFISTPSWANGGRTPDWTPTNTSDFADFVEAAAKRYPTARYWLIWVEPTKASNFQPLKPDRGKRLRGAGLEGPRIYASMLDESYARLKALSPANKVVGGNTFTVGTVAPLRWIRALKLPNGRRPRMDLWGHNPFSARVPNLSAVPLGNGYADFSDLDELAKVLDRAMRRAPKSMRRLKLFLSEYSLPTDHPNFEFNFYVRRSTQAAWIKAALKITRRYRRIHTFGYLGLYDPPLRPGGDQVDWGLITREDARKPAYAAYRDN